MHNEKIIICGTMVNKNNFLKGVVVILMGISMILLTVGTLYIFK